MTYFTLLFRADLTSVLDASTTYSDFILELEKNM